MALYMGHVGRYAGVYMHVKAGETAGLMYTYANL